MDGKTFLQIRRGLEKDGIKNGAGNTKWWESNIRQILTNEKYIGDALLQKTYTVSVLEKKRSQNDGNLPKYYVEGCHEAIIDKDVFLRVQAELAKEIETSAPYVNRVIRSKETIVNNTLVKMIEEKLIKPSNSCYIINICAIL